jgi:hypothetical protein
MQKKKKRKSNIFNYKKKRTLLKAGKIGSCFPAAEMRRRL